MFQLTRGSSGTFTIAFTDQDGAPVVPASVTVVVKDIISNTTIRTETPTPASTIEFAVLPTDTSLVGSVNTRESKRYVITATYGDNSVMVTSATLVVVPP